MKILILGGTQLVGPFLLNSLIKEEHEITLFNRGETNIHLHPLINRIKGNRRHLIQYKKELQQIAPDIVIDMIALTKSDAEQLMEVFSPTTEKFIVISSGDVYMAHEILCKNNSDHYEPMPLLEDAALRQKRFPYRGYAKNEEDVYHYYDKTMVENIINTSAVNSTILRFPFVYGPGDLSRLLPYLTDMQEKKSEILLERAKAKWRCTRGYVENIACAITQAAQDKRQGKFIYNVGELDALTEKQWLQNIATLMNWQGNIIEKDKLELPQNLQEPYDWKQNIIYDTNKIREELNYKELISSEQALKNTLDWALSKQHT